VTQYSRLLLLVVVLMGGLSFWSCSKSSKPKKPLEGLYIIAGAGKFGFIDKSGKVVIQPQFQFAFPFSEGLAQIRLNDGTSIKVGFIDKTGKADIQLQFSDAADFSEGLALVRTYDDGKTVFVDKTGNIVLSPPPEVEIAGSFSDVLALVRLKKKDSFDQEKYGYMDKTGKIVITPQFEIAFNFSEGLAAVKPREDKPFQYIDKLGKSAVNLEFAASSSSSTYVTPYSFSEGLAAVNICDSQCHFRFIDKTGKIIGDKYDYAEFFREGVAVVGVGTEAKYSPEWMRNKPEYYRPKYSGGKYGYIDNTGTTIIKAEFDEAYAFNDGIALVRIKNKYGYIDKSGKIVINPQFDEAEGFQEGLAYVAVGNKRGYINTSGQFVWSNGN
jgi:hypothetical protein